MENNKRNEIRSVVFCVWNRGNQHVSKWLSRTVKRWKEISVNISFALMCDITKYQIQVCLLQAWLNELANTLRLIIYDINSVGRYCWLQIASETKS
jgi:hypothetical protein